MSKGQGVSRRRVLAAGVLGAGVALVGGSARGAVRDDAAGGAPAARKRVLRLAHLTDTHIQPERAGLEGTLACLRHMQAQKDAPTLLLAGGDLIMDSFDQGEARTAQLWDVWDLAMKECGLPVEAALGNHDIWGWNKERSGTTGTEAGWGKARAMERLGLAAAYRAFDRAGWRFVVLDSVQPLGMGYGGGLDDGQFAWLEQTLAATPATTPVLVLSHIPIISSVAVLGDAKVSREGKPGIGLSAGLMFLDYARVIDLFARHSNVKVALSGHIHMVERLDMRGVTYLCNGAASGAWWWGPQRKGRDARVRCEEGYALLDLYDDGTIENAYVEYGWEARVEG